MADDSNVDDVIAYMTEFVNGFNMEWDGPEGKLGQVLLDVCAERVSDRTLDEQIEPSGSPFRPLKPQYERWKVRKGYPATISYQTGEMMSMVEVQGERTITPDSAEMRYGKTEGAKNKARWFTEGGRTFYGRDDLMDEQVRFKAKQQLRLYVQKT